MRTRLLILILFLLCGIAPSQDIVVGSVVQLVDRGATGIPGHDAVGHSAVTSHVASNSTAKVLDLAAPPKNHWIRVHPTTGADTWITTKYVDHVIGPGTQPPPDANVAYSIGCWNLEHFGEHKTRGFPESGNGGPSIPPRTDQDLTDLAHTITQTLDAKLLALSEINGRAGVDADGDPVQESVELNALMTHMPANWTYRIASSGESQRLAFVYDTSCIRVNELIEIDVAREEVQGKDIFARDPLVMYATLMVAGQARNDLVIVAVHLASEQQLNLNHDRAMDVLQTRLAGLQASGHLGGTSEHDVLILGDMNANMFAPPAEQFFLTMDEPDGPWDVLAEPDYPATRLSGVPLDLHNSAIDYIIASRKTAVRRGLSGEEITEAQATVHEELIGAFAGPDGYRRRLSDHLPVTVRVRATQDNDS